MIIIMYLFRGSPTTQSAAIMGSFVTARKWPSTVDPAISISTIQAVRKDSATDLRNPLKLMSLLIMDMRRTAAVPTLPASVGVNNPFISPHIISKKITTTNANSGREAILSFHVDFAPLGPRFGLILHH